MLKTQKTNQTFSLSFEDLYIWPEPLKCVRGQKKGVSYEIVLPKPFCRPLCATSDYDFPGDSDRIEERGRQRLRPLYRLFYDPIGNIFYQRTPYMSQRNVDELVDEAVAQRPNRTGGCRP